MRNKNMPKVGEGATEYLYSDVHAYTVVDVLSHKKVVIQQDKAVRTDKNGMSTMQSYTFERDPGGSKVVISLRKSGSWRKVGRPDNWGEVSYVLGKREEYYDYSF